MVFQDCWTSYQLFLYLLSYPHPVDHFNSAVLASSHQVNLSDFRAEGPDVKEVGHPSKHPGGVEDGVINSPSQIN
jgi:hypothetical protein